MKAQLEIKGQIQLEPEDITQALRILALKRAKDILEAVSKVVYEQYKVTPIRIQKDEELTQVVAIIDEKLQEGAKLLGKVLKAPIERESNRGFKRTWTGFYGAAEDIFNEMRAKRRHTLKFDDFYNLLLDYDDVATGGKLFIKPGADGKPTPIEKTRAKQYLSPSQLKKTPQMKGIKFDPKKNEFRF